MTYNLRNKRRECYWRKSHSVSANALTGDLQPKVLLEVLDILQTSKYDRFKLKNGKITPILSNSDKSKKTKVFWMILFSTLILVAFYIVKDDFRTNFEKSVERCLNVYKERFIYLNGIISFYVRLFKNRRNPPPPQQKSVTNAVHLYLEMENKKSLEVSENNVKDLIAVYVAKKKNQKSETENNTEPLTDFIKEQCKNEPSPQLADNLFSQNFPYFEKFYLNNTDYALQSMGAKVLSTLDTEPYGVVTMKIWKFNFGILPKYFTQRYFNSKKPSSILETWKKPGDCWAFKGSRGRVQIQFSKKIIIRAVAVEHIPKNFSDGINLSSAPKKFSVIGLEDINSSSGRTHLGIFEFVAAGPHQQIFTIEPRLETLFSGVEVNIESNHRNDEYTCVYKIRVYGH